MSEEARDNARVLLERGVNVVRVPKGQKRAIDSIETPITTLDAFTKLWREPDYNSGLVMGHGRGLTLVAIDLDHKILDDGTIIDGAASLRERGIDIFKFGTWWQRTPSGGYHFVFQTDDELLSNRQARSLLDGVDIRGHHGIIVGPGSVGANGVAYEPFDMDAPFEPLPSILRDLCTERKEKDPNAHLPLAEATDVDRETARHFLQFDAPPAIENRWGNDTTYDVACELRDLGLGHDEALAEMAEHYNPRCVPPWSPAELRQLVDNAYRYAQNRPGCKSMKLDIKPMARVEFPHTVYDPAEGAVFHDPPRWAIKDFLQRGTVTTMVSPGGVGKSLFTTALSVCLAYGNAEPLKMTVPDQPISATQDGIYLPGPRRGRVALFNNEDPNDVLCRRVHAACNRYGWPYAEILPRIIMRGKKKVEERVVLFGLNERKNQVTRTSAYYALVEWLKDEGIVALVLDPLSSIMHGPEENSNSHMATVMGALNHLAIETGCAVLVVSHSRKGASAGDTEAGRGASAIRDGVRRSCTLYEMSEAEAEVHQIEASKRKSYVRLDGTKANYSPLDAAPKWYKKVSETVPENPNDPDHYAGESDAEAAIEWVDLSAAMQERRETLAAVLQETWPEGRETWSMDKAIEALKASGETFALVNNTELWNLLSEPLDLGDGRRVSRKSRRQLRVVDSNGKSA